MGLHLDSCVVETGSHQAPLSLGGSSVKWDPCRQQAGQTCQVVCVLHVQSSRRKDHQQDGVRGELPFLSHLGPVLSATRAVFLSIGTNSA
jgi:hypothetical protein